MNSSWVRPFAWIHWQDIKLPIYVVVVCLQLDLVDYCVCVGIFMDVNGIPGTMNTMTIDSSSFH